MVSPRRMPESVVRKRPAQVISPPPPGVITGPLPAPRPMPGRNVMRYSPKPKAPPRPPRGAVKGRIPVGLIALALLFLGLFVVAMGLGAASDFGDWFAGPATTSAPPRAFPVLEPSRPEQLLIPALRVQAPILDVGLAADGSVDVPPLAQHDQAGWFDGGPTPGQFGPALIVGHADTRTGPSVFYKLGDLKPGQRIQVVRADKSVAVFEVNSVEHFDKGKLPIQRVYGDYSRPSLRLMTCGGSWLGGKQGYSDNIVVFASLVEAKNS